jgi:hypothetical protein
MLTAGIQSIGYRQFYDRVISLTGIKMCEDDITNLFLRSEDSEKLWRTLPRRKETVKITRMQTLYKKLRDGVAKLTVDNAKAVAYETGMMGPGGGEGNHCRGPKYKKGDKQKPIFCHCGWKFNSLQENEQRLSCQPKKARIGRNTTRYGGVGWDMIVGHLLCYVT